MPAGYVVYEDVVFDWYEQDEDDIEPWAMVCNKCNEELLEGAGSGEEVVFARYCYVQGCMNIADIYITLVGSKPQ